MTGDARRKVLAANVADDTPEAEVELQLARLASRPTTLRTPANLRVATHRFRSDGAAVGAEPPTGRLEVWT